MATEKEDNLDPRRCTRVRRTYVRPELVESSVANAISSGAGSKTDRVGFPTKGF
jgi:hypothetical protein